MERLRSDAESIFLAALERTDRAHRDALVAAACAADDALRRRVEALLRAHDAAGSFLGGPPGRSELRADDRTEVVEGRPADDTLTILSHAHGEMPRVLLCDPAEGPDTPVPGPPSPGEAAPQPPSVRYQFFGEIARGGMGAVLKGRDAELNRDLAFKVLLDRHRDNPELVKRFVEEAQIGGQLQHPGIVPIHELGVLADRRPFFAMKLVKGRTLAEILRERPDPSAERPRLLSIFEAVCQTVAYAHARGVIHRDRKPSNVMVGSFGEVQVMDWGLAKVLPRGGVADDRSEPPPGPAEAVSVVETARSGSDADASRAGSVLGTPGYMAPEQARGELARVDERADVFGLGAILCKVLTGRPAFAGRSSAEVLRLAGRGELSEAFALLDASGADAELIALARDCLAPEPEGRPRRAGEVAERLTAYLAGVQERLRAAEIDRARAEATAAEERRRRRLQLGLAALLLALTTLGGLALTYEVSRRQAAAARVDRLLAEARLLRDQAQDQPEDVARWDRAREALGRIGEDLGASAASALAGLRREVEAGRGAAAADRGLLARLVDIRSARADDPDGSATDAAYADAFAAAGIDPDRGDPAGAGAGVARRPRPVAAAMVAALDDWAAVRRGRDAKGPGWARVLGAARAADPDPDRDALRAALLMEDRARRLGKLRPLAERADPGSWAPASLTLLGGSLAAAGDVDAGLAVLRRAAWFHPEDARIHSTLGQLLEGVRPPQAEDVIRAYSVAWARQPELAGHDLSHALERRGRGAEAEAVWRDLVGRRPENGRHLGCYGRSLKDRGRVTEAKAVLARAVAACREAIRLKPDDTAAQNNLGLALRDLGDLHGAVAAYREAIRLRPDVAEFHANLGNALSESGDLRGAIAAHREAIRLKPDFAGAHEDLGNALRESGDVPGAIGACREAIRLKPDLAEAHDNLGIALRLSGDVPGAIAAHREAIRLKPDRAAAHTNLGNALYQSGDVRGAIAEYREAIRLKPDFAGAHSNLGIALRESGDVPGAIGACREAIRLKPDLAEAHTNLGNALYRSGDVRGAIAAYREAIRLRPDFAGVHSNLANALLDSGDVRGAIAAYREVARLSPSNPILHYHIARLLVRIRDLDEAIDAYREAARRDGPHVGNAIPELASTWERLGRYGDAIATYRRILAMIDGDPKPDIPAPRRRDQIEAALKAAERLAALADRLPAILAGTAQPADNPERLALARAAFDTRRYATAARLWSDAMAADPKLGDDRRAGHHYNAACAAALAAAGRGQDEPPPDAAARAELRRKALDWLKAELAASSKALDSADPKARAGVAPTLRHWKEDPALAGVRDPDALAAGSEAESAAWRALWAEVDRLLSAADPARK